MRINGEQDSSNSFAVSRRLLMDIASKSEETGSCKFRCHHDASCLTRWSQVCDGRADCGDLSDEANCPPPAALLQPPPNPLAKPSYSHLMEEISGVQICIVAVALVLTLGLITCVINHYNKMGGRSWSGDQRRHGSSRKPKATATRAVYSPAQKAAARKEELLYEHQLQMLSVQRDIALDYPHSVCRPDLPECRSVDSRTCEAPKTYIKPPPNRIVCNSVRVCPGANAATAGSGSGTASSRDVSAQLPQVHKLSSSSRTRSSPANHTARSRDLVKHTSSATLLLPLPTAPSTTTAPPSRLASSSHVVPPPSYQSGTSSSECTTVNGWRKCPPVVRNGGHCTIDLFSNADNKGTADVGDDDDDDPPPKYEDVVFPYNHHHHQPHRQPQHGGRSSKSSSSSS